MHSIKDMKVMPAKCNTCPFGENGDPELVSQVLQRTMGQASQICHHPRHSGNPETHLCRGARDVQLRLLVTLGYLSEATDEAFEAASKKYCKTNETD